MMMFDRSPHKGRWLPCLAVALMLSIVGASGVSAQSITVNNNLIFGDIFPGIPKTIDKANAGYAAEFQVSGTAGDEVTIDFTLPTYLNQSGFNMQIIFKQTDCALDSSATPDQSNPGYDDLNPWHTITYNLGLNGLTIWLGGTVVPRLNQINGTYTQLIVLTVAYTGN
jgi:hypothetical protein